MLGEEEDGAVFGAGVPKTDSDGYQGLTVHLIINSRQLGKTKLLDV